MGGSVVEPKQQEINEAEHRRSFTPQVQRILQIIKHLFDPVIKALAKVREVQEKARALGSSGSFCCALDKCLLPAPQPNPSGVGEETSLSLQPFAPSAHSSLSCPLPGCLHRRGKSEGTRQALSAMCCTWDKGKGKVVDTAGSSAEIWGGRTDPATPKPSAVPPSAAESSEGKEGISCPQAWRGDRLFRPACCMPAHVKLAVSSPLTVSPPLSWAAACCTRACS